MSRNQITEVTPAGEIARAMTSFMIHCPNSRMRERMASVLDVPESDTRAFRTVVQDLSEKFFTKAESRKRKLDRPNVSHFSQPTPVGLEHVTTEPNFFSQPAPTRADLWESWGSPEDSESSQSQSQSSYFSEEHDTPVSCDDSLFSKTDEHPGPSGVQHEDSFFSNCNEEEPGPSTMSMPLLEKKISMFSVDDNEPETSTRLEQPTGISIVSQHPTPTKNDSMWSCTSENAEPTTSSTVSSQVPTLTKNDSIWSCADASEVAPPSGASRQGTSNTSVWSQDDDPPVPKEPPPPSEKKPSWLSSSGDDTVDELDAKADIPVPVLERSFSMFSE